MKKVYGILAAQLSFTMALSALIMFVPAIQSAIIMSSFLLPFIALGTIGCVFALEFKKQEYPTNFILLGVFVS